MSSAITAPKKPSKAEENPYLTARRTWNEQVGSLVTAHQTWQVIGIVSMLIALAAVGGIIHIGSQSKFIPYVVEVDKHGQSLAHGVVQPTTVVDSRILHATVAEFIQDARMVTADAMLQRKAILRLYSRLSGNDPATAKMNEWLGGSEDGDPFKRAAKVLVSTELRTVVAQSPDTWQVEWVETVRNRKGQQQSQQVMRALVTVYVAQTTPQTTDEQIRNNPLGIYVRDFSWAKVN